jgi:hypothetical protein
MTDDKPAARPGDPYRRNPPVIDLAPRDFRSTGPKVPAGPDTREPEASEPATAIEPVAATGLDGAAHAGGSAEAPAQPVTGAPGPGDAPAGGDEAGPIPVADAVPPVDAAAPPPTKTPERSGRGVGSLLAASLIGGVVGAAATLGADMLMRPPGPDLDGRVAALEARPQAAAQVPASPGSATQPPADLAPLERRLAALETANRTLTAQVGEAQSAAQAAARQSTELAERPAPATAASPPQTVAEPDPALRQAVEGLGGRVEAAERAARAALQPSALDEVRTRLDRLQGEAEERQRAAAAAAAAVQTVGSTLTRRLDAGEQRLAALTEQMAKLPPGLMQAGLRSVAAGQAADALRAGAPLGPAIAALERLEAPAASLAALKPYGAQGAPSAGALQLEFKPLADRILAEPQSPTGSVGDRLLRIAEKIVTVRAVGDGSGRDLPGTVARIDAALGRGALADAAVAWETLPEAAKSISAEWGAKLRTRVAAETAARRLASESLAALDAPAR